MKNIQLIAEVKTESPFGYVSNKSWDELFALAEKVGDMLSIHTDARWRGSFELITKAKSLTHKPILAKGIHETDELVSKAVESGADFVLVVGRIPKVHLNKCLIEPNTLEELRTIPKNLKVVWNSRDLSTGGLKKETFAQARKIFPGWLCQASNIHTIADIDPKADAVLVGTSLIPFAQSLSSRYTGRR
jgi:indole-3-glycerol phosphate synthase